MTTPSRPAAASDAALDVITVGRASIDLYGQQIGSRLEDVASFAKSVGGCPANIAIGAARLGLKPALLTRVGGEQMGRFIIEQMQREGVSTKGIRVDAARLTALAILSVESDSSFPLLFYRENCADMALCEDDIDETFVASSRAVLVTGTHFSRPGTDAAQRKAMRIARAHGRKLVLDIDYRPNLWGLAGHAEGDSRYVRSEKVSARLGAVLGDCDLIVGTEEEVLIASGADDLLAGLQAIRAASGATIVLKRGPMGCIVYEGDISAIEDGIIGRGFPIEVYNVLGAGDGFMAGFLRGWLGGESLQTAATWANACGALAVSRLLCSPEYPSFEELQFFLNHGSSRRALRNDPALNHVHWATNRRQPDMPELIAFACDHRRPFEEMADAAGAPRARIGAFKLLAVNAAASVARGRPGYGMLLDETYGRDALFEAAKQGFSWLGRPVEAPGSRPLRFESGEDVGAQLIDWPIGHTVKCLCFYHPDDPEALKREQQQKLLQLFQAARKVGRELMIEIAAGRHGIIGEDTTARALGELCALGIKPDWWKLEPQASSAAWRNIEAVIAENDPWCRGIVLLGLDAPQAELEDAFAAAADIAMVKGFAVGRTIFGEAARKWLAGETGDEEAVKDMAARFEALAEAWTRTRARKTA
jgi:5-dehydro-2-deoxygluconokinase